MFRDWLLKCVLLVAALAGFGIKAEAQNVVETGDSVGRMRVDVSKTSPQNEDDIKKRPIDLVTPKNMKEDAERRMMLSAKWILTYSLLAKHALRLFIY